MMKQFRKIQKKHKLLVIMEVNDMRSCVCIYFMKLISDCILLGIEIFVGFMNGLSTVLQYQNR